MSLGNDASNPSTRERGMGRNCLESRARIYQSYPDCLKRRAEDLKTKTRLTLPTAGADRGSEHDLSYVSVT